jgi:hypothetical protein
MLVPEGTIPSDCYHDCLLILWSTVFPIPHTMEYRAYPFQSRIYQSRIYPSRPTDPFLFTLRHVTRRLVGFGEFIVPFFRREPFNHGGPAHELVPRSHGRALVVLPLRELKGTGRVGLRFDRKLAVQSGRHAKGKYFPITTFRRLFAHTRLTLFFNNQSLRTFSCTTTNSWAKFRRVSPG